MIIDGTETLYYQKEAEYKYNCQDKHYSHMHIYPM